MTLGGTLAGTPGGALEEALGAALGTALGMKLQVPPAALAVLHFAASSPRTATSRLAAWTVELLTVESTLLR